jgi:hypothetical protein
MLDETAKGVFTIAVTPFLPDGALDLASIDSMVDFYEDKGATGLTILGMMGEAGKLSAEESVEVVTRVTARASVPSSSASPPRASPPSARWQNRDGQGRGGRDGRPAGRAQIRRPDPRLFRQRGRDAGRHPLGPAGFPAGHRRGDVSLRLPEDLRTPPHLRDAETRGLAGAGKDQHPPAPRKTAPAASRSSAATAPSSCWRR